MPKNIKGIKLVICESGKMVLPVYTEAFGQTRGNLKKLCKRYTNALVLNSDGSVSRITKVSSRESKRLALRNWFSIEQEVSFTLVDSGLGFDAFKKELGSAATSNRSYSVWTQFYNNSDELLAALAKASSLEDICNVLHIHGDNEVANNLC